VLEVFQSLVYRPRNPDAPARPKSNLLQVNGLLMQKDKKGKNGAIGKNTCLCRIV
jgi:hypothetical protein